MIYGYVNIDVTENEKVLEKQVSAIKKYGRKIGQDINLLGEITDKSTINCNLEYKQQLKNLQKTIKEGDTVVFATLDSIFPYKRGVQSILSIFYTKRVNVIVLDFPVLQTIKVDPVTFYETPKHQLYNAILSPILEYRYMLQHGEYTHAI